MAVTPSRGGGHVIFFLVDSWAVTKFVVVLTFDIADTHALHEVVEAIQTARLPHTVPPLRLARADVADRVLAEFDKDET